MTKTEIRRLARDLRESLRYTLAALDAKALDEACDLATQTAGLAGEIENAVEQFTNERTANRFQSDD